MSDSGFGPPSISRIINFADIKVSRVELLLVDPSVQDRDGTELAPDPGSLDWSRVPFYEDPDECVDPDDLAYQIAHPEDPEAVAFQHCMTSCPECLSTSWNDYYVRIYDHTGACVYDDSPSGPDTREEND